nr:MAG TPA: hypothetical protein [Caudoviricetes sp.]
MVNHPSRLTVINYSGLQLWALPRPEVNFRPDLNLCW